MPQYAANGLRLHYEAWGGGEPVILLHGFTSTGATWHRLGWTDLLIEHGFRAIALDFPGHGKSEAPPDPARVATVELAADVVALLDALALPRAALVGFSMGGAVALQVALDAPGRVTTVVAGGVGDAALNDLHDPAEVTALASNPRVLRNAHLAGNDFEALLPYLETGGWPAGLASARALSVPLLLLAADRDEYMQPIDELVRRLRPESIVRLHDLGHHDVLVDERVKRQALRFLDDAAVRG